MSIFWSECGVCGKSKSDVRFEGSVEMYICDSCLEKQKELEGDTK